AKVEFGRIFNRPLIRQSYSLPIAEPEDVSKMARNAARVFWSQVCAVAQAARCRLQLQSLVAVFMLAMLPQLALAEGAQQLQPVKGEASFSSGGGFARLVFKFAQ